MDDRAKTSAAAKSIEGIPDGCHVEYRAESGELVLVRADGEEVRAVKADREGRLVR